MLGQTMPRFAHRSICAQACSRTAAPMAVMVPVSSALLMNASGYSRPRSGWRHRTRVSTAVIRPVRISTMGW